MENKTNKTHFASIIKDNLLIILTITFASVDIISDIWFRSISFFAEIASAIFVIYLLLYLEGLCDRANKRERI